MNPLTDAALVYSSFPTRLQALIMDSTYITSFGLSLIPEHIRYAFFRCCAVHGNIQLRHHIYYPALTSKFGGGWLRDKRYSHFPSPFPWDSTNFSFDNST
eukprot:TRINITY_DN10486_c0_g1_i1.p1 TRINITY_DN10486_c0_g1~~TRINITY_DN10486_c0_g1_i1.p1  ORF type:complete len:112 (-),score=2.92 TRINITY_DN10486_c0_g1_i1:2-301(-)